MSEGIRINKYISEAGVCSRREADRLIDAGKVLVDGVRAQTGMRVYPGQQVQLGRRILRIPLADEKTILLVNKPRGIVCTASDKEKDNIVRFLRYPKRLTYAGRLDKESSGLLIMTDDGDLINAMMRSANGHEKEYHVTVDRPFGDPFLHKMAKGVPILDTVTRPCKVKRLGERQFSIVLTQGLNRQIRRMCEALGYKVRVLRRVRIMNLRLDGIKEGTYRPITDEEKRQLFFLLRKQEEQSAKP